MRYLIMIATAAFVVAVILMPLAAEFERLADILQTVTP